MSNSQISLVILVMLAVIVSVFNSSLSKVMGGFEWQESNKKIQKYNKLIDEKKYQEAWDMIEHAEWGKDPRAYFHRGIFIASKLLNTGKSKCDAVLNLEKAQEMGLSYSGGALNSLYGGDWASIAAHEGERVALFILGFRNLKESEEKKDFLFLDLDKLRGVKIAIKYLSESSRLGYMPASIYLKTIQQKYKISIKDLGNEKMIPQRIVCGVREYK